MHMSFVEFDEQPRVRDFFMHALAAKRLSHAYLFLGGQTADKRRAVEYLAAELATKKASVATDVSSDSSSRNTPSAQSSQFAPSGPGAHIASTAHTAHTPQLTQALHQIKNHSHPDVTWLEPASAKGYLVGQVRDIIANTHLAPVLLSHKIYVLQDAGLLWGSSANALLKTLEEPLPDAIFILFATSATELMPTLVSRCQLVPFAPVATNRAYEELMAKTLSSPAEARSALALTGSADEAAAFLRSPSRRQARREMLGILDRLSTADDWDVIEDVRTLAKTLELPLAELKQAQAQAQELAEDFLSSKALKQVAQANKRSLSAHAQSGMIEAVRVVESVFRDVLLCHEGMRDTVVNEDAIAIIDRLVEITSPRTIVETLRATAVALSDIHHNVTSELTLEGMLLAIKEALACPPLFR